MWASTFTANSEHLVSGGDEGVRVWRVDDGRHIATMKAAGVRCLAVSKDNTWIAAGTDMGEVVVWDAKTYGRVFTEWGSLSLHSIDFSPDATRFVTASEDGRVTVWDLSTGQRVHTHHHYELEPESDGLLAARYSPQGDRIATATWESIRVYDSNDGHVLGDYPVTLSTHHLVWLDDSHLLVVSDEDTIKQLDASTGSTVLEWTDPHRRSISCIVVLPRHGRSTVAYSADGTVALWDSSTRTQHDIIHETREILGIDISPDDQSLAIVLSDRKVVIKSLSRIAVSVTFFWTTTHI